MSIKAESFGINLAYGLGQNISTPLQLSGEEEGKLLQNLGLQLKEAKKQAKQAVEKQQLNSAKHWKVEHTNTTFFYPQQCPGMGLQSLQLLFVFQRKQGASQDSTGHPLCVFSVLHPSDRLKRLLISTLSYILNISGTEFSLL